MQLESGEGGYCCQVRTLFPPKYISWGASRRFISYAQQYAEPGETNKSCRPTIYRDGGKMKADRDLEKDYPVDEFVAKLRRLADCLESGQQFEIQIAGERIYVPVRATYNIEHEREGGSEEIEFQIKWDS